MGVLLWGSDFRTTPDSRTKARKDTDRALVEKVWQASVVERGRELGWTLIYHHRPAWVGDRGNKRMITNTLPEGAGFPDLIFVGHAVAIAMELKRESNKPTPAQEAWLEAWAEVPGTIAVYARPRDRELVWDVLARPWAYLLNQPSTEEEPCPH
jgi:hypothetical protein